MLTFDDVQSRASAGFAAGVDCEGEATRPHKRVSIQSTASVVSWEGWSCPNTPLALWRKTCDGFDPEYSRTLFSSMGAAFGFQGGSLLYDMESTSNEGSRPTRQSSVASVPVLDANNNNWPAGAIAGVAGEDAPLKRTLFALKRYPTRRDLDVVLKDERARPDAQLPQAHRARSDDWICGACGNRNFYRRQFCNIRKCRAPPGATA